MTVRKPAPSRPHRGGTFNLKKGAAVSEVAALLVHVDWLAVQEVRPRARALRKVARAAGFRVWFAADRDSAILVRRGVKVSQVRRHSLGGAWWERKPGRPGLHPPRFMVSLRIGGLYRVGSVHLPPGPHESPRYPRRRHAMLKAVVVLSRITRRWSKRTPWVLVGDWNQPRTSPLLEPIQRSVAEGVGVDWVMGHRVSVADVRALPSVLSDHRPRVFTVNLEGATR